jgi:hypothetical protein
MFILIVKDPDGDPPERAVLDRRRASVFTPLHVLELVAPHFCANFSRLSNLDGKCQANRLTSLILFPLAQPGTNSPAREDRAAPNFERPGREHHSRGRLTARWDFTRQSSPGFPFAMDCSVGLPRAQGATTVEQTRFALHHNWGKNTLQRSLATATNLVYFSMPFAIVQTGQAKATG